jgi:hypothetical protein
MAAWVGRQAGEAYRYLPGTRFLVQAMVHEYLLDDLAADGTAAWWLPLHTWEAVQPRQCQPADES